MAAIAQSGSSPFSPQSPSDLVGEFGVASPAEAESAVQSARSAQREWWARGAAGRSAALAAAANELRARRDEAIALVVREVGKPVGEATGEVARAISILDYYAQACFRGGRRAVPAVARRPAVHAADAARRRGDDHAVEFPARDPALEDGAGARVRQRGPAQAVLRGARVRRAARASPRPARRRGRVQRSSTAAATWPRA